MKEEEKEEEGGDGRNYKAKYGEAEERGSGQKEEGRERGRERSQRVSQGIMAERVEAGDGGKSRASVSEGE